MRVALMVEGQEGVSWPEWLQLAELCEEGGFDALLRSDHYTSLVGGEERLSTDAWTLIGALAARTSTLRLGTLVSPATFRHPAVLAKAAATADHISGGRIELGIGAGWNVREHRAFGFPDPHARSYADFEDYVHGVRALLDADGPLTMTRGEVAFEAAHLSPLAVQQPLPIVLGGTAGPRSAALGAACAQEYNSHGLRPSDVPAVKAALDAACREAGRDPSTLRFSVMTGFIVGRDEDEIAARAEELAAYYRVEGGGDAVLAERGDRWIIGTPAHLAATLQELAEVGVDRVMLQHHLHRDLDTVALIRDEVLPALSG